MSGKTGARKTSEENQIDEPINKALRQALQMILHFREPVASHVDGQLNQCQSIGEMPEVAD
jgi:hypothetical protein